MDGGLPSSRSSTVADDTIVEVGEKTPHDHGGPRSSSDMETLERLGSQKKSTEANIFQEREVEAEAQKLGWSSWEAGAACSAHSGGLIVLGYSRNITS
jgi:hypothetical protein